MWHVGKGLGIAQVSSSSAWVMVVQWTEMEFIKKDTLGIGDNVVLAKVECPVEIL